MFSFVNLFGLFTYSICVVLCDFFLFEWFYDCFLSLLFTGLCEDGVCVCVCVCIWFTFWTTHMMQPNVFVRKSILFIKSLTLCCFVWLFFVFLNHFMVVCCRCCLVVVVVVWNGLCVCVCVRACARARVLFIFCTTTTTTTTTTTVIQLNVFVQTYIQFISFTFCCFVWFFFVFWILWLLL